MILIVLGIGIFYFINNSKSEELQNDTNVPNITENNNTTNNSSSDNNSSSGNVSGTFDNNVNTTYDENGAFLMPIEDVLTISSRRIVVTGTVVRGKLKKGDTIQIIGLNKEIKTVEVDSIESFRTGLDNEATIGDYVGIRLIDVNIEEVKKGQVLAAPGSIKAYTDFTADIHMLTEMESGISEEISEFDVGQFYFTNINIDGSMYVQNYNGNIKPGESGKIKVYLTSPVAMEVGTSFYLKKGGHTVGTGVVTSIE